MGCILVHLAYSVHMLGPHIVNTLQFFQTCLTGLKKRYSLQVNTTLSESIHQYWHYKEQHVFDITTPCVSNHDLLLGLMCIVYIKTLERMT